MSRDAMIGDRDSMSVLVLGSSAARYGSDLALLELSSCLRDLGWAVAVTLPCDGPLVDQLGAAAVSTAVAPLAVVDRSVGLRRLAGLAAGSLRARSELVAAHPSFRPDVVYSNTSHVLDGPALARSFRAAHVWQLREIERIPRWARLAYGRWLLFSGSRVLSISRAVHDAYFPSGGRRAVVVPDGVDVARYQSDDRYVAPAEFDGERPLRLVTAGRLTPWKGQDVAIAAVGALLAAGLPVELRVVGGALTEPDRAFELRLRELARPYGSAVALELEVDDVRPLYRWSDVVIHTAVSPEPFGRVVVEAMSAGRAVIASDAGGPREIVRDGVDGLLSPPGDATALAASIERLARSPQELERLASAARERARSFSMETTARQVAEILADVRSQRPVSSRFLRDTA